MLKSKGYSTGHFGKWHMGPKGYFPEQMGFDINIGGNEHGGPGSYFSPYKYPNMSNGPKDEYLTDRIGDEVVKFIEKNKENNFFAYVPFFSRMVTSDNFPFSIAITKFLLNIIGLFFKIICGV
jgi:arylsulfatase A-like enzyme